MIEFYGDLGFIRKIIPSGTISIPEQYFRQPPNDKMFISGRWVENPFEETGIAALPVKQSIRDEFRELRDELDDLEDWEDAEQLPAFDCPPDASNRPNVLTAYCPLTAKEREHLLSSSLDLWQAKVLGDFEKCLPNFIQTVTGFYLYRWGHAFAVPVKGVVFATARRLIKKPFDRIFICPR